MKYLVCDLETTGTSPMHSYIIAGHMIMLDEYMKEVDSLSFTMRPRFWDERANDAVAIHGISREKALMFPIPAKTLPRIYDFINQIDGQAHFVCHANRVAGTFGCFDRQILQTAFLDGFLNREGVNHFLIDEKLPVHKVISTHTLAKAKLSLDSYRLSTVCQHLGIPLQHHNAKSDCEASAEILRRLWDEQGIEIIEKEIYGGGFNTSETQAIGEKKRRSVRAKS